MRSAIIALALAAACRHGSASPEASDDLSGTWEISLTIEQPKRGTVAEPGMEIVGTCELSLVTRKQDFTYEGVFDGDLTLLGEGPGTRVVSAQVNDRSGSVEIWLQSGARDHGAVVLRGRLETGEATGTFHVLDYIDKVHGRFSMRRVALPPAPARVGMRVALGELVFFERDEPVLRLHRDGRTQLATQQRIDAAEDHESLGPAEWRNGPLVSSDGVLRVGGNVVGEVRENGVVIDAGAGLSWQLELEPNLVSRRGAVGALALGADGSVLLEGVTAPENARVEGAATPELRRTALVLLGVRYLMPSRLLR